MSICVLQGGVVLLALTLCMQVGYNSASRKLSVDVGGAKKLHALSTLAQATVLCPWAAFIYFTREVSNKHYEKHSSKQSQVYFVEVKLPCISLTW